MNWNKNNNDNNPWGSGGNNNPWGSGGSGDGPNRRDFEDSIKKAKDRFGNFKFGGRRNISIFIIVDNYDEKTYCMVSGTYAFNTYCGYFSKLRPNLRTISRNVVAVESEGFEL